MKSLSGCCAIGAVKSEDAHDARVPQSEVASVYDKIAAVYDVWGKLTESRARNRGIELANIRDGQAILEVAAGTGLAFSEIVRKNPRGNNLGIDLSQGMLDRAKKRLSRLQGANFRLLAGTAFDLPLQNESIDVLMNNYMFDLIPFAEMDKVIMEFRRVLKKGGRLVLVNMTEGETRASRLYSAIYRIYPKAMGGCRGVKMAERLRRHGFAVESREYYQQMCFPSEVILAVKEKKV